MAIKGLKTLGEKELLASLTVPQSRGNKSERKGIWAHAACYASNFLWVCEEEAALDMALFPPYLERQMNSVTRVM